LETLQHLLLIGSPQLVNKSFQLSARALQATVVDSTICSVLLEKVQQVPEAKRANLTKLVNSQTLSLITFFHEGIFFSGIVSDQTPIAIGDYYIFSYIWRCITDAGILLLIFNPTTTTKPVIPDKYSLWHHMGFKDTSFTFTHSSGRKPVELILWTQKPLKPATSATSKTIPDVSAKTIPDASAKTIPDASAKTIPDASAKTIPGASTKTIPDASAKPIPDVSTKTIPDASTKTIPEASTKTIPDTSAKTIPDTSAKPIPDVSTRTIPDASAKTIPGASTKTIPDASAKPIPDASAKTIPDASTIASNAEQNVPMDLLSEIRNLKKQLSDSIKAKEDQSTAFNQELRVKAQENSELKKVGASLQKHRTT